MVKKLLKLLLVFFIPSTVFANIHVTIKGSLKPSGQSTYANGNDVNIIDETEVKTFSFNSDTVKDRIKTELGKRPNDVYLKSPTPWGDLYKVFNWLQVKRAITVVRTEIIQAKHGTVEVMTKYFNNSQSSQPRGRMRKIKQEISVEIENNVTSKWPKLDPLTGIEIQYDIKIKDAIKPMAFKYSASWGEAVQKSQAVSIGTTFQVYLYSGQTAKAIVKATKVLLKVRIDYEATLSGNVAIHYEPKYKDHHFYMADVDMFQNGGGLNTNMSFTEVITMAYYTKYDIEVRDARTNVKIKTYS